jgi:hypothetical protein
MLQWLLVGKAGETDMNGGVERQGLRVAEEFQIPRQMHMRLQ